MRLSCPCCRMNVVNGGAHAQNAIDLQEFMVVPAGAGFAEALRIGADVFHALKALFTSAAWRPPSVTKGLRTDLGSSSEAIEVVLEAAERAEHRDRVAIALDRRRPSLERGRVPLRGAGVRPGRDDRLLGRRGRSVSVVSIEDALAEDERGRGGATQRGRRPGSACRRRPLRDERRATSPRNR